MTMVASPATNGRSSLPPPLRVAPDMAASWQNVRASYDDAAHAIVEAHARDGEPRDHPVMDLSTWGVVPRDGLFTLAPLHKGHGPLTLVPARALRGESSRAHVGQVGAASAPTWSCDEARLGPGVSRSVE